jgi:hypothetical protein
MKKQYKIFTSLGLGFLLALGFASEAFAQRTVTGLVKDDMGVNVTGAMVAVKDSATATITGADGTFTLNNVPSGEVTLVATFLGMQTTEVTVSAATSRVTITMATESKMIDEVVVMGVSQTRRINVTGAVGTVGGSEIVSAPVANVTNALVGNAPGVTGLQTSGEP